MFLYATVEFLKEPTLKVEARHLCGILFKNTVLNKTKDSECDECWEKLQADQKEALKAGLLEALGCDNMNVVRAAASAISAVCTLEIPKGNWLKVIDLLCTNSDHESLSIRHASILTLGYISEELFAEELEKNYSDIVITAFLESLEKNYDNPELIEVTIQGIYHSLKFTVDHFKQGQGKVIMDKVIGATKYPEKNTREIGVQCIVEIVRLCYDYIEPFMGEIADITQKLAKEDVKNVKTQALEVWSSIAEEEHTKEEQNQPHHGIIETAFDMLIPLLEHTIQDLNIGNEEVDEEQEWGTSTAAGCCLSLVTLVVKDKVVQPITDFVAKNIQYKDNWEKRY